MKCLIFLGVISIATACAHADDAPKAPPPALVPRPALAGIGALLTPNGTQPVINEVLPNGPSAGSGLQAQDTIVRVDYRDVKGLKLNEVVELIRGEPGTSVVITVRHAGESKLHDFTITRGPIKLKP